MKEEMNMNMNMNIHLKNKEKEDNSRHRRQPCEIWTRVMGYYRPTFSFNIGKLGEYKTRIYFDQKEIENRE